MLNADKAPRFDSCPRCGDGGLQIFSTHSYCVGCNYSDVYWSGEFLAIPAWAQKAFKAPKVDSPAASNSLHLIGPKESKLRGQKSGFGSNDEGLDDEAS
jgi:hypothetical protein